MTEIQEYTPPTPLEMIQTIHQLDSHPWDVLKNAQKLKEYQQQIRSTMQEGERSWLAQQLEVRQPELEEVVFLKTSRMGGSRLTESETRRESDTYEIYIVVSKEEYQQNPSNFQGYAHIDLPRENSPLATKTITDWHKELLINALHQRMDEQPKEVLKRLWKYDHPGEPESSMPPIEEMPYIKNGADEETVEHTRKVLLEIEAESNKKQQRQEALTHHNEYVEIRKRLDTFYKSLIDDISRKTREGYEYPTDIQMPAYNELKEYLFREPHFSSDPASVLEEARRMETLALTARYEVENLIANAVNPLEKLQKEITTAIEKLEDEDDKSYFRREVQYYIGSADITDLYSLERGSILQLKNNLKELSTRVEEALSNQQMRKKLRQQQPRKGR